MSIVRICCLLLFLFYLLFLLTSGCASINYTSRNDDVWGEFDPDCTYELYMDVFLIRPDHEVRIKKTGEIEEYGKDSKRLALVPPGEHHALERYYSAPETVEAYRNDPEAAVRREYEFFTVVTDVVDVIEIGTLLRCHYIKAHFGGNPMVGYGRGYEIYAEVLNGPYVGKIVNIDDLDMFAEMSNKKTGRRRKKPDPRFLRLVEESQ